MDRRFGRATIIRSTFVIAMLAVSICSAPPATASQGPGLSPGTASPLTQQAMAIVVYGAAAALIAAGLIGAARRR